MLMNKYQTLYETEEGPATSETIMESVAVVCNELSPDRVRSIYTQIKDGTKRVLEIAQHYNLPIQLVSDIKDRKIFTDLTSDL